MRNEFLSCNGLGCSPAKFILALFCRPKWRDIFQCDEKDILLTYQGRFAIYLACKSLQVGPGDEVIVPAYNCGAEVDPYVWAGAKVIFYRVDSRARIDVEDIMSRVTPFTKIIHVTHFFGWPQEIRELGKWCREKGLFLLEDCALALFSRGREDVIGKTGNAAFYSFVKTLSVPDGGALVIKDKKFLNNRVRFRYPRRRNIVLNSLPLLKKWYMNTDKIWQSYEFTRHLLTMSWLKKNTEHDCQIGREMPKSNYFDGNKIDWTMSKLSQRILSSEDPGRIAETRRRNYLYLHSALQDVRCIEYLFNHLPEGVCPLSFPIFVKDRNYWCNALEGRGITIGGWPSYHKGFSWDAFPESKALKDNLLTLPVHQDLEVDQMEYIAKCIKLTAGVNANHNSR